MNFKISKEYNLKLGEADPEKAIYLGPKRITKVNIKHAFLSYNSEKGKFGVYLGRPRDVEINKELVHMKFPNKRKLKPLEIRLLEPLFKRLNNA